MLARYMGITPQSQSYLFTTGLALTLLGMALTDMWIPMVAGAVIMTALAVESWVRVLHIIPLRNELRDLHHQVDSLQKRIHSNEME